MYVCMCVCLCREREREREKPELVEDMAADGDGLDIFNNGLEIFVADRANGLGKSGATDHLSLSLSLSLSVCAECSGS
jgi:hypothetical protein